MLVAHLKNFKSGDVQNTDEMLPLLFAGQGDVAALHQPDEQPVVDGLAQGPDREKHLFENKCGLE